VSHPGIEELGPRVDALAVKAREDSGGGSSVKTFVMEANANLQCTLLPPARILSGVKESQ
jgi:hypothetical protein